MQAFSRAAEGIRTAFLASTPPGEGEISWKVIQTYADGRKVRWIEPPDGESPAAVTLVSKRYPRQNVGGEGRAVDHRRQARAG